MQKYLHVHIGVIKRKIASEMALLRLAIVALILIARYNVEAWFFKGFASWLMPMKCHSDDGKIYFAGKSF